MLWDASAINGFAIEASDGPLGAVGDVLFEGVGWANRWLIVHAGKWLSGRKVLLPHSALGRPDKALRRFAVNLTRRQVEDSPNVDTDRPVSRQTENELYEHCGWHPYWGEDLYPVSETSPHLRSLASVRGYRVHATDGEIGHVEDFLVDDVGWSIRYVAVDARNWWPEQRLLVSRRSVQQIDWTDKKIYLSVRVGLENLSGGRAAFPSDGGRLRRLNPSIPRAGSVFHPSAERPLPRR
jgi:hypothetical protein